MNTSALSDFNWNYIVTVLHWVYYDLLRTRACSSPACTAWAVMHFKSVVMPCRQQWMLKTWSIIDKFSHRCKLKATNCIFLMDMPLHMRTHARLVAWNAYIRHVHIHVHINVCQLGKFYVVVNFMTYFVGEYLPWGSITPRWSSSEIKCI